MADKNDRSVGYKVEPQYKKTQYLDFPKELNPEKKDADYCRTMTEAIYACHIQNQSGIFYRNQTRFEYLRQFGGGDQDMTQYIKYFFKEFGENPQTERTHAYDVDTGINGTSGWTAQGKNDTRKGGMNVFWEIVSPAPKIRESIIGKFMRDDYVVTAEPVDPYHGAEKENEKYKLWAIAKNLEFVKQFAGNMNAPFEEPTFLPDNQEELELFEELGGFKPAFARQMEKLIQHTNQISDWEEIKSRMLGDVIDTKVMACFDYLDYETNEVKTKYLDPARCVVEYSDHPDFHDASFAGHFEDVPISELRQYGFSDEQLQNVANYYKGYGNNPGEINTDIDGPKNKYGHYNFEFMRACVFICEWIDTDGKQYLRRKNKNGRTRTIPQEYGTKNTENENNQTVLSEVRNRYQCYWVVGTDYVYNYGKSHDITRKTKNNVNLCHHFYQLNNRKSITEKLIPFYHNFFILWVKFQNAIAMARNAGYAIDYDAISTLTMGDDKYSEDMIIQRFLETGNLVFKRKRAGSMRGGSATIPVYELKSNLKDAFAEFRHGFLLNAELVESITGFNPLTTGGTPDKEAPVATSEISLQATNDTLRNILKGYVHMQQKVADNQCLWLQLKIKTCDRFAETYQSIIGNNGVQMMKMAEGNGAKYGIEMQPRPTQLERQEIFETAKISLANGREGKPGITEADYFMILHLINSGGSIRLAEMVLSNRIRRAKKEAEQAAIKSQQVQSEEIQKQQQQKAELERQSREHEADLDIKVKRKEHEWKMIELRLEKGLDTEGKINEETVKQAGEQQKPKPEAEQ